MWRRDPDDVRRPPDLRLVPAALVTWAAVLLGLGLGPPGGVGALLGGLILVVGSVSRRCRPRWAPTVRAVGGCAAAAGLVVTVHALQVDQHPLRAPAERGAAATARVVLTDDPRPIRATTYGSRPGEARQVLVPAAIERVEVADDRWTTGGRVLLIAPAEGWRELLPGQRAEADGLLAPATRRDLTVAVLRVRGPPRAVDAAPWWQDAAGGLREGLRAAAAEVLAPAPAGLLPGLAVGDTSTLTAEVEDDFRAAGLQHLTAVSGANLAIVAGAVLALLRLLRADPRLAAVLSAVAVLGFVVLARPSPSVVRAAAMGAIVLLALALGRGRSAVPALAAAVLVLLLADPALAVDPGFALSVLATGALVLLAPGWTDALRRRRVPGWVAESLTVPAAAFLVTAPLVAGLNGEVSAVAVLANLLAVPAVAPATVLGVLAAVLSPVGAPLAQACAWAAGPAVGWLVLVADRSAAVQGAVLPWPDGLIGATLLAGLVLVLLGLGRSPRWRAVLMAVLLGLALVLVPTRVVSPGWPPRGWALVACDVGQGDAVVLATARPGWVVLVDAGPEDGLVDACLDRLGVHGIALVVLSHLHADHVGGLAGALRGRAVAGVAVGPVREPRWALEDVAAAAAQAGAPVVELAAGRRLHWPGLTLDVLGPRHPPAVVDAEDGTAVNDGSVVLRAATAAGTVLLAGDIELAAQADLLDSGVDLRADILKMPHHGSRYTSVGFLHAVRPRAVLVSVGAGNRYRHPDPGLVADLERGGATVRRTDLGGDVAVVTSAGHVPEVHVVSRGSPLPARRRTGGSPGRTGSRVPRRSEPARRQRLAAAAHAGHPAPASAGRGRLGCDESGRRTPAIPGAHRGGASSWSTTKAATALVAPRASTTATGRSSSASASTPLRRPRYVDPATSTPLRRPRWWTWRSFASRVGGTAG